MSERRKACGWFYHPTAGRSCFRLNFPVRLSWLWRSLGPSLFITSLLWSDTLELELSFGLSLCQIWTWAVVWSEFVSDELMLLQLSEVWGRSLMYGSPEEHLSENVSNSRLTGQIQPNTSFSLAKERRGCFSFFLSSFSLQALSFSLNLGRSAGCHLLGRRSFWTPYYWTWKVVFQPLLHSYAAFLRPLLMSYSIGVVLTHMWMLQTSKHLLW